jgi:hypothetical protein
MSEDRNEAARGAGAPAPMGEDPATALIRADYVAGQVTVAEIRRRHGISQRRLYRLVDKGGWSRRQPRRLPANRAAGGRPDHLLVRLQRLAGRRSAALERSARQDDAGVADHERLLKALTGLLTLLGRIEQLKGKTATGTAGEDAVMTPEEADARRQMLAQKLVAMLEQASGRGLPGGS